MQQSEMNGASVFHADSASLRIQTGMSSLAVVVLVQPWVSLHQQLGRMKEERGGGETEGCGGRRGEEGSF